MRAVVRYVMERIKWELAGKPMRSAERIYAIYHEICKTCPRFGVTRCNECGCLIRDSLENPSFNKLAWATTKCPLPEPKWTEELEPEVDVDKARELAEKEVAEMERPPQVTVSVNPRPPPQNQSGCCGD